MAEEPRLRLGRGLAALIGDAGEESPRQPTEHSQRKIPIEFVRPNPQNPRKEFTEENISELADSIREKGILQPIVVRATKNTPGVYEIIAGERRWRAAQRAGVHEVPVVVVEANDKEALELAIIENVQRADLNPVEEADAYGQLIKDYQYTQADLAKVIGKSRSHVANTLRLANLGDSIKRMLATGDLSAGHARALLTAENPEALAKRVVDEGLSVRDVERLSNEAAGTQGKAEKALKRQLKDADTLAMEKRLQDALGLSVSIIGKGENGALNIRYDNFEQLDFVCKKLID